MTIAVTITPAAAGEWAAAVDLVFQHLPAEERLQRRANVQTMLSSGEITLQSILVARQAGQMVGAMVCLPLKGASALFWPPQVLLSVDGGPVADSLVQHGLAWRRLHGTKIAQAIIPPPELPQAAPLLRCGFRHITRLQFSSFSFHQADHRWHPDSVSVPLVCESYQAGNQLLFQETLERTYEGTLDCPELNGRRTMDEIIAGHRGQGNVSAGAVVPGPLARPAGGRRHAGRPGFRP